MRAVIAQGYERIHRSNLAGMGVLPLEFLPGESVETLGLSGRESFTIRGIAGGPAARSRLTVVALSDDGDAQSFDVVCRLDGPIEEQYYREGGILPAVLRRIAAG